MNHTIIRSIGLCLLSLVWGAALAGPAAVDNGVPQRGLEVPGLRKQPPPTAKGTAPTPAINLGAAAAQRRFVEPGHPPEEIKPAPGAPRGFIKPGQVQGFNPQPEPPAQIEPTAAPATGFAKPQVAPQVSTAALRQRLLAAVQAASPSQAANALPPDTPQGGDDDLWLACTVRDGTVTIQPAHHMKPLVTPMHTGTIFNKNPDTGQANSVTLPAGTEVWYVIDGPGLENHVHKQVLWQTITPGQSFKVVGPGAPAANLQCLALALEVL